MCVIFYEQRKEFVKYAKVFPLCQTLSFKIPSKWYRRGVGGLEILFGGLLAFFPNGELPLYILLISLINKMLT